MLLSRTLSLPKLSVLMALEWAERSITFVSGLQVDLLANARDGADGLSVDNEDDVFAVGFSVGCFVLAVVDAGVDAVVGQAVVRSTLGRVPSSANAKSFRSM